MPSWLVALPLVAWACLWAVFYGEGERRGGADWRGAFLRASIVWGTYAALSAEALSPFRLVTPTGLSLAWVLFLVATALFGVRRGSFRLAWSCLKRWRPSLSGGEWAILAGLAVLVLLLLAIAWISPPNNVDSLLYHMARVAHWVQGGSLDHFPAGYEHQLTKPTWAETAILHLRVLFGHDKPANLVQWFSMLASLVGASAIAGQLSGSRRAQLLAAALVVSIPMGILQATSTQNDYVVAAWAICLACFVIQRRQTGTGLEGAAWIGLATGVGMLSKGTGYIYSLPLLVWGFWPRRQTRVLAWLRDAALVASVAMALNLGFWVRNIITFGGPFGTSEWLSSNLTLGKALIEAPTQGIAEAEATEPGSTSIPSGAEPVSEAPGVLARLGRPLLDLPRRTLQVTAYQLVTPFQVLTRRYATVLELFPGVFPVEQTDWIRRLEWNHEDFAPSPLHMSLSAIVILGLWLLRPRAKWAGLRAYTAVMGLTYVLLPLVIGHGVSIWGIRYVLPFLVLSSPLVAVVAAGLVSNRLALVGASALLGLSLPWTLLNNTRPLLTDLPYTTRIESILEADRTELLLANLQRQQDAYWNAAMRVEASGCRALGLRLPGYSPEYPFWWMLDATESGIRIESVYHSAYTDRYVDPDFMPCMIICSDCPGGEEIPGYSKSDDFGWFFLLRPIEPWGESPKPAPERVLSPPGGIRAAEDIGSMASPLDLPI